MATFDTRTTDWQTVYKVLVDAVQPRPIGLISTVDAQGRPNLAPYSFFNMISARPPICYFGPSLFGRDARKKDSLLNVEEVPEFVANIVSEDMAEAMNQTSYTYDRGVSEFAETGLTPVPSTLIRPPRVAESPVALECRVVEIKTFGEGPGGGTMVLGEVLLIHVRDGLQEADGRILPATIRTIGRLGGSTYCRTTDVFDLHRPKGPTK